MNRRRELFSAFFLFCFFILLSWFSSTSGNYKYLGEVGGSFQSTGKDSVFRNRSYCCLSSENQKDICGRGNCTWPCPSPVPSIPQLNHDQLNSRNGNQGFFLETSRSGALNFRQACAVESLAYQNPNLTVFVLFIDAEINTASSNTSQLTNHYKNIHFVTIHMDDYLSGTPLENWYHCTDWRKGPYHISHLSDGLRFLTVAKYGGYYFDLDVIQVRPVTFLRNFVTTESGDLLASCAFHADYGSPVMQTATEEFSKDYKSHQWTHNGPALLVRIMKKWCHVDNLHSMNLIRCKGTHLLPTSSFNPVHYTNMNTFFEIRPEHETGEPPMVSEDVVGIHIFNKLSSTRSVYKNSSQYYTRLARSHCPFTFSIAPDVF